MGIDQAHEPNNKTVKVDWGAIEILDDEATLLKWAVAGPIISKMIEYVDSNIAGHNEVTGKFEADFKNKRSSVIQAFPEVGNPFLESENQLIHLISKQVMNETARDPVEQIPPTQDALLQHMKRATVQSRSVELYDMLIFSSFTSKLYFSKLICMNYIFSTEFRQKTIPSINALEWGW